MSQIKQLQPKEGVTIYTVLLPEGADNVKVTKLDKSDPDDYLYLSYNRDQFIKMPCGKLKLLGKATEIPEEVWQRIVKKQGSSYKNYSDKLGTWFNTATESAMSLLEKHEVYSEKPDDCPNQWCDGGKIDMGYNEYLSCELCEKAEANTGTWVILQRV